MNKLALTIFIIISFIFQTKLIKAQCHIDDWTALKAIYESTNGDNWTRNTNWEIIKNDLPPSDCDLGILYGITLLQIDQFNERVFQIDFSVGGKGNGLTGNLPIEIKNLRYLTYLNLAYNNLTGKIPPELGDIRSLLIIDLSNNSLSGSIPPELGNLNKLGRLDLPSNDLTGIIPAELGNLDDLEYLNLSYNQLSGCIPSELGNLNKFNYIELNDNNLGGCYPENLVTFCKFYTDFICSYLCWVSISEGNNFSYSFKDFCGNDSGICGPEPPICGPIPSCEIKDSANILVSTNYSGEVQIDVSLNPENEIVLKNQYVSVFDYSKCSNYEDIGNCCPVTGVENLSANEAICAATKTAEYFLNNFDIQIDPVNIIVNYTDNPFTAVYKPNHNIILLGKGDGKKRSSMAAPDIIIHEYLHAIIDSIKYLGNYSLSGALNESYADIFAEIIEFQLDGNYDWILGEKVMVDNGSNFNGLRNLSNPMDSLMEYQMPEIYGEGMHWVNIDSVCFHKDLCGVHTNSGVHSYWFYLLSESIDIEKAAKIIIDNLKVYLNSSSTFHDAREGSILIVDSLFNNEPNVRGAVIKAWDMVGVFEKTEDQIEFKITNTYQSDTIATNPTTIPVKFDLTMDKFYEDLIFDELCFTLHLPESHENFSVNSVYPPFTFDDFCISVFAREANICISPQCNLGKTSATKDILRYTKEADQKILQAKVCIVSKDAPSEPKFIEPIEISGYTKTGTFEEVINTATLPLGFDHNQEINGEHNERLEISLKLKHQSCYSLGNIEVEILNKNVIGVEPYTFTLIDNNGDTIKNNTKIYEPKNQFYGLEIGDYELIITDSLLKEGRKKISIDFVSDMVRSLCCPDKLTIPPGKINSDTLFNATDTITFSMGTQITSALFDICR